ncbi:class I SAM-dependent methyltransferase [Polyangium spumosum]|nr:class I SAM-dependent methyltransferase [Polyangium spumosum]
MGFDFEEARRSWDAHAEKEEAWLRSPSVNRALRIREIERRLDGVRTILDVGGGTGAFSLPLAQRGFEVVHVDFSPAMLDIARRKAGGAGNIRFVEANAVDLSMFADRSFDLVLNMDGPISASGAEAPRVLGESCRVARRTLIVTAAHGAWAFLRRVRGRPIEAEIRTFLAAELRETLEAHGMTVLRAGGLGSLAHLCGDDFVKGVLADAGRVEAFLDECERFDAEVLPEGPGTNDDTGLIGVAERG